MTAEPGEQPIEIVNEFAAVRVRKVHTRNGQRLEISSPRLGYAIRLDALALESLTWQTMDTFTRFLETPFGPPEHERPAGPVEVTLRPWSTPQDCGPPGSGLQGPDRQGSGSGGSGPPPPGGTYPADR
jgi:hypothetical protein